MIAALLLAATLAENVAAVTNAAAQIDAAIVAKGGETAGGLRNAAAAIAALPSGGDRIHAYTNGVPVYNDDIIETLSTPRMSAGQELKDVADFESDYLFSFPDYGCFGTSTVLTNFVARRLRCIGAACFYNNPNIEVVIAPNVCDLSTAADTFQNTPKLRVLDFANYTNHGAQPTIRDVHRNMFRGTVGRDVGYGGLKIFFTNCTYSAGLPFTYLPFAAASPAITNAWFFFRDGMVVKYIDGAWTPTQEY